MRLIVHPSGRFVILLQARIEARRVAGCRGQCYNDRGPVWDGLRSYVEQAGLWYTIADETEVSDELVNRMRSRVEDKYGPWSGQHTSRQTDGV